MIDRILRVLGASHEPCGCVAGVYQTYAGAIVTIIDVQHSGCRRPEHRVGATIGRETRTSRVLEGPMEPVPR